jgi:hypothetical protein
LWERKRAVRGVVWGFGGEAVVSEYWLGRIDYWRGMEGRFIYPWDGLGVVMLADERFWRGSLAVNGGIC